LGSHTISTFWTLLLGRLFFLRRRLQSLDLRWTCQFFFRGGLR
jgi:hypothetical protein